MKKPPIFIGGTGRSGTTIMAKFIASHKDYCLPAHEIRFIVDRNGLRTLSEYFKGEPYESVAHHAIDGFLLLSRALREKGIKNPIPRSIFKGSQKLSRRLLGRNIGEKDFKLFSKNRV